MREQKQQTSKQVLNEITAPAYPWTGHQIFRCLRAKLSAATGVQIALDRLVEIIGRPRTTVYLWFDSYHHKNVQALFACLEQLSPAQRNEFIDGFCRPLPTIGDPRFGLSSETRALLADLLKQERGLIIITAGRAVLRNAFFTALVHCIQQLSKKRQKRTAGIDLHRPDTFVPAPGIIYLEAHANLDCSRRLIFAKWLRVLTSTAPVLCLNGVWAAAPELRRDIIRAAARRSVIVADREVRPEIGEAINTPIHEIILADAGRPLMIRRLA